MNQPLRIQDDSLEGRAETWRDRLDDRAELELDLDPDGEPLSPVDLACFGLAMLQKAVDRSLVEADGKTLKQGASLNGRVSVLQLRLRELEAERQRQAEEAGALRERVARLETEALKANAKLTEAAKAIADLRYELARDRSYARMVNERRFAPIAETTALAAARKRTDLAIQGKAS
jgi:septal ring factor EnvC (AmiA/AmiB activator)